MFPEIWGRKKYLALIETMNKIELEHNLQKWFNRNWEYYRNEVATNITVGKMGQYTDDLCIHCFEEFSKKTDAQKQQMLEDDKIINFLLFCAGFQLKSSTSPFYAKYRKKSMDRVPLFVAKEGTYHQHDNIELDDYYICMMECLEEENEVIDWYEKKLLKMKYLEQMPYYEMKDTYGFSQASIKNHIQKAMNKIENYCNKKVEL